MGVAYLFDSEWTDRKDPEIIETALTKVESATDLAGDRIIIVISEVVEYAHNFWKPSKPISFGAMAKHHIVNGANDEFPPSSDFRLPADCEYLIGHSIDQDWKAYLNTVPAGTVADAGPKRICTHAIATHLWQDCDSFALVALVYMLHGKTYRSLCQNAHGADSDVALTYLLLQAILKARPDIQTWPQLHAFSEECRIPIYCPFKNREGVKIVDLDDSYLAWVLDQHWIDGYLRTACERVVEQRQHLRNIHGKQYDDDQESSDWDDEDDRSWDDTDDDQ
jgi:exodeoxyribonuclease X